VEQSVVADQQRPVIYSCNNQKGRVALVVVFVILLGPDKVSAVDSTSPQIAIPSSEKLRRDLCHTQRMIAELQMKYSLPNSTAKMRTIKSGQMISQTIDFIARLNRANIRRLSLEGSVLDLDSLCRLLLLLRLDRPFICLSTGFGSRHFCLRRRISLWLFPRRVRLCDHHIYLLYLHHQFFPLATPAVGAWPRFSGLRKVRRIMRGRFGFEGPSTHDLIAVKFIDWDVSD
jgi:hypothetical protein